MIGTHRILIGDVLAGLATLGDGTVQTCVTSPPYWGLRDYGTGSWEGGDAGCDHKDAPMGTRDRGRDRAASGGTFHDSPNANQIQPQFRDTCGKCGAVRIDQQIGLEPAPAAYLARMVAVFREVRRVLADDGTIWVNMGDGYNNAGSSRNGEGLDGIRRGGATGADGALGYKRLDRRHSLGLIKCKDLIGMPWRLAFALQADGWYLRSDIIWHKPNPMPESVTDRPTKAHEYLFLLSKRERYYFDNDAIREPQTSGYPSSFDKRGESWHDHDADLSEGNAKHNVRDNGVDRAHVSHPLGRNIRTVWTIPTQPFPDAHFATYPEALVEPCVKAGTSERGCCPKCGKGWVRKVEKQRPPIEVRTATRGGSVDPRDGTGFNLDGVKYGSGQKLQDWLDAHPAKTTGWSPACACNAGEPVPCLVLDPFTGSGTTGAVACRLGRNFVGCELNPAYAAMARDRIGRACRPGTYRSENHVADAPLFVGAGPC